MKLQSKHHEMPSFAIYQSTQASTQLPAWGTLMRKALKRVLLPRRSGAGSLARTQTSNGGPINPARPVRTTGRISHGEGFRGFNFAGFGEDF